MTASDSKPATSPPSASERLAEITTHFYETKPWVQEALKREFRDLVSPIPSSNPSLGDHLGALSSEWFLFDFILPNGMTPLQDYCQTEPAPSSLPNMDFYRSAHVSHFTADFEITDSESEEGHVRLRSMHDDSEYRVKDNVTQPLKGRSGQVGMRLFEHEGEWMAAGSIIYLIGAPPSKRRREMIQEHAIASGQRFIEIVKRHFGMVPDCDLQVLRENQFEYGFEFRAYFKSMLVTEFDELCSQLGIDLGWSRFEHLVRKKPPAEPIESALHRIFNGALERGFPSEASRQAADKIKTLLETYELNSKKWR